MCSFVLKVSYYCHSVLSIVYFITKVKVFGDETENRESAWIEYSLLRIARNDVN